MALSPGTTIFDGKGISAVSVSYTPAFRIGRRNRSSKASIGTEWRVAAADWAVRGTWIAQASVS